MAENNKWIVRHNADQFHETVNIKYLCYDVATLEGFCWRFILTPKGLNVCTINKNTDGNTFSCKSNNNNTMFWGMCYTIVENDNSSDASWE